MRMRMKAMGTTVAILGALALVGAAGAAEMPTGTLEKLVGLYVPMQEALAGDSVATVKEQAAKVATEAEAILTTKGEKPSLEAIEGLEAVVAAAKAMNAAEIPALREQFKPLSHAVAKLVERQAVAGHGIYFCPMADAYWIQKSGAVKNPYYGAKMLGCGEVVKKVEA
jgi:Cu(I)/Ag(I) efflux system membrane fusion protein